MSTPALHPTPRELADRRVRLQGGVAKLAAAIAAGTVMPDLVELRALAVICQDHGLVIEAARVQRWLQAGVGS